MTFSARLNPPVPKLSLVQITTVNPSLMEFGLVLEIPLSFPFIATVINVVVGVIVGGIWGISKSIDRIMMEVYNVIFKHSIYVDRYRLDLLNGIWFLELDSCHVLNRMDRNCLYHSCPNHALP